MTTAGPWSVKGIDPKAREIAKDLARRSGMTLGEWLNHMIIEGEEDPAAVEPAPYDRTWLDAPRTRTQAPGFSATETLRARINRELGREEPARARDAARDVPRDLGRDIGVGHNSDAGELQRLGRLLADLSSRIEGSDTQVAGVLSRVENADREQTAAAARLESVLEAVRADQSRLGDRLRRVDGDEEARMEAIKALEGALNKVAGQIYEGESRSRATIAELREDVSALARRVERAEAAPATDKSAERRLESIAVDLARKIEEVRGETTARLKEAAEGRSDRLEAVVADLTRRLDDTAARLKDASDAKTDRLERTIRDVAGKVAESETRTGEGIDRMGREVVRVAQSMAARMQTVEGRSTAATERMGAEVARIAEAMEGRLRQADAAQAESLDRLGGELTRIAEKLADRIAASERRAAGAVSHMGDQLSSATDGLKQHNDAMAADFAERIRASEERTAKLLADTRETLDKRLAQGQAAPAPTFGHHSPSSSSVEAPPLAAFEEETPEAVRPHSQPHPQIEAPPPAPDPFGGSPFATGPFEGSRLDEGQIGSDPVTAAAFDDPFGVPASHGGVFDDFVAEQPFAADPGFAPPSHEPARRSAPMPEMRSTRDMISAARAAARAASESRGRRAVAAPDPFADAGSAAYDAPYDPTFTAGEFSAPEVEVAAEKARRGVLGFGFPIPRRKKEGPTLKTLLMASAVAATLSVTAVGAVGLVALDGKNAQKGDAPSAAPEPHAALAALERSANDPSPSAPPVADTSTAGSDRLAMALSPPAPGLLGAPAQNTAKASPPVTALAAPAAATTKVDQTPAVVAPAAATQGAPRALYAAAIRQIEAGDASGTEGLKKAANLGYAPAEFYLAKLFETGGGGLRKDSGEARRWTQRAAQAGDSKAMHNLALYWFEGTGGPKDPAQAADWFKRAAERGVQDSQYNLARLYEQGFGVSKNPAEAYKWYLVAGAGGDAEAKTGADTVKRQLSTDAQTQAEHAAQSFRAQIAASQMRTASVE